MKSLRKVRGFKVGDVITFDENIPLNMKFKFNSLPPGGQKVCRNKEEVLRNEWIFIQSGNDDCGDTYYVSLKQYKRVCASDNEKGKIG